jgi:hypothetical protein
MALKPSEAQGLSTKTAKMKNTRILFAVPDPEKVVVLAVVDRRDVVARQNRLVGGK